MPERLLPFEDAHHDAGFLRKVTVLRYADRHAHLHCRGFAEIRTVVVAASDPLRVIEGALSQVDLDLGGRFAITVEEPHE